jgi:hypothetical protein
LHAVIDTRDQTRLARHVTGTTSYGSVQTKSTHDEQQPLPPPKRIWVSIITTTIALKIII